MTARSIGSHARKLAVRRIPSLKAREKYKAELAYWRGELRNLEGWYIHRDREWWGSPPPSDSERVSGSDLWTVQAVSTLHHMRPTYLEELQLSADEFAGERVLEVGCGPLAPCQQFDACERHGLDPLIDQYVQAGWPIYAYDMKFVSSPAEKMPYPAGWFDAVISVNALDHVDDFQRTALEIQRVLRPGGKLFFEIEYHKPSTTEPLSLTDEDVRVAFSHCDMTPVVKRDAGELQAALAKRFNYVTTKFADIHIGDEVFTTWHGVRR
jgi:SAM-dependent methyltransferase